MHGWARCKAVDLFHTNESLSGRRNSGGVVLQLLDELQKDSFPVKSDQRPARCTGTALSVAAGLLGACVPGTGARILAFVGGPCTEGSGTVCSDCRLRKFHSRNVRKKCGKKCGNA